MNVRTLTSTVPLASKAAAGRLTLISTAAVQPRPLLVGSRACAGAAYAVHHGLGNARHFSSTPPAALRAKEWFPPPKSPRIKYAGPAWEHPV